MVDPADLWLTVALGGLATYLVRLSFFAVAHRAAEPPLWLLRILRMIPPAALAALAIPPVLRPAGEWTTFDEPRLWAAVVACVVAWRTKSLALTFVVGMGVLVALDRLAG